MKLKEKIIRWLGGYTPNEVFTAYQQGKHDAYKDCKHNADELYGESAEEWCDNMYHFLEGKANDR